MGWRPKAPGELDATLVGLIDLVAGRLRSADRVARTVAIRLRFTDFARIIEAFDSQSFKSGGSTQLRDIDKERGVAMRISVAARSQLAFDQFNPHRGVYPQKVCK